MSHPSIHVTPEWTTPSWPATGRRKKTGTWQAEMGPFRVEGQPTRAAAIDAVMEQAADFNGYRRTYLFTREGSVFCVYQLPGQGYGYDITGADRAPSGIARTACSSFGRDTYEEAMARAIHHIETGFGGLAVHPPAQAEEVAMPLDTPLGDAWHRSQS
jgi:hypothetical protein